MDAITFCNQKSEQDGLTPVYTIDGDNISWNREADGYRLPTEAEWEYACRAGTTAPFNMDHIPGADECNFYGHYPYEIEQNYFNQGVLDTKPGEYRQTTVAVDSFSPNAWGFYNMHGNVSEWVWDYYGAYNTSDSEDPTCPATGSLKVYRGGGWNDFGKNTRSAYRGTLEKDKPMFNVGIRLVRNAVAVSGTITTGQAARTSSDDGKVLVAYFSWSGNTRGIAQEIQRQTGADIIEITLTHPYSSNYNTVLDEAQHDQSIQARPEIAEHIDNMDEYGTIILGYPNWWASIPMPIASFLEEYDFRGNTVKSFCRRNDVNGNTTIEPSVTLTGEITACENCGREIQQIAKQKKKRFCCDKCRNSWWNSHLDQVKRKAVYDFRCPYCGKEFSIYGDRRRKYCSHECYIADRFKGGDGNE